MNPGQQQFFNFILERTLEDKQEEVRSLLEDSFKRQAEGTFNMEYLNDFNIKLISLLKPEAVEEVSKILKQFGSMHTN